MSLCAQVSGGRCFVNTCACHKEASPAAMDGNGATVMEEGEHISELPSISFALLIGKWHDNLKAPLILDFVLVI